MVQQNPQYPGYLPPGYQPPGYSPAQPTPQDTQFPSNQGPTRVPGEEPDWSNLKAARFDTPVAEFVGTFNSWETVPDQFADWINLFFNQCQVIKTDAGAPYPSPDVVVSIKYSEAPSSAWGRLGRSIAEKVGVDIKSLRLSNLRGHTIHLLKDPSFSFGKDRNTGQELIGTVWSCVQVGEGSQQTQAPGTVSIPTPQPVGMSPRDRALQLLNGKTRSDFFSQALPDPIIRSDGALLQEIVSQSFVTALLSSGKATENNGIITVH